MSVRRPIPSGPGQFNWDSVYPEYEDVKLVEFLDISCGHGGALVTLSPMFPHSLMLGIDPRDKVVNFVERRIESLRNRYKGQYTNIGAYKIDSKVHLQNYFYRGQFTKMIFHYPDPAFELRNDKHTVINHDMVSEHAYLLAEDGKVYIVSENREIYEYVIERYQAHSSFEEVSKEDMDTDPVVKMVTAVEKKGYRLSNIRISVFRKLPEEPGVDMMLVPNDDLDDAIIDELMKEPA